MQYRANGRIRTQYLVYMGVKARIKLYEREGIMTFEEKEIKVLEENNCKIVTLGNRILRTETVAIAMTSVILYEAYRGTKKIK